MIILSKNFYFKEWHELPSIEYNKYYPSSWRLSGFEDDCIIVETTYSYNRVLHKPNPIYWDFHFSSIVNIDSMIKLSQMYYDINGKIEFETAQLAMSNIDSFLKKIEKLKIFI